MLKKRFLPLLAIFLILAQAFTGLFTGGIQKAAAEQDLTALKQYSIYAAFRSCILMSGSLNNPLGGGNEAGLMTHNGISGWAQIGWVVDSAGGATDAGARCFDMPKLVMSSLNISGEDLVKGLGYQLGADGNWSLIPGTNPSTNWDKFANSKGIPTSEPTGYSWYYFALAAYKNGCKAQPVTSPTDSQKAKATSRTDGYGWVAEITDSAGTTTKTVYQLQSKSFNDTVHAYPRPNSAANSAASAGGPGDSTCGELLTALDGVGDDATTRYANYLIAQTAEAKKKAIMEPIDAYCLKTYPNGQPALQYQYCLSTTYNAQQKCWGQIRDATDHIMRDRTTDEKVECMKEEGVAGTAKEIDDLVKNIDSAIAGIPAPTQIGDGGGGGGTTEAACTGGALGWILCPVLQLLDSINKALAKEIENQLYVALTQDSPYTTSIQPIWSTVVGIANLVLIIAFLIVIFSQATSIGLSAYGIKKMLPRIIAAAILINLSFFICSVALDIANVIGNSVQGIIALGMSKITTNTTSSVEWGNVALDIGVSALGITGAVLTGTIGFLVPIAIAVVGGITVLFLGLAMRKVLIVLLIIVAPLAFAAMILPGTEPMFKKWGKSFIQLLIMYPVIVAILYGSALVAKIILAAGNM